MVRQKPSLPAHGWRRVPVVLLLLTACVTVQLKKPIADFASSVEEARNVLVRYFETLNEYERRLYLDERLFDPTLDVATKEKNRPTPLLTPPFHPTSIAARLEALTLLGEYAQRLAELALSDAPSRATDAGALLGKNLTGLGERLAGMSGDQAARPYAGPVSTVIAILGEMWIEEKREKALRAGIERGTPAVRRVIDLLETDLTEAVKVLRTTGEQERLAGRVRWYNRHRSGLADDLTARRALLDDIDDTVNRYQAAVAFDPTRITGALRSANEALLALARSPREPKDLNQYAAAMERFAAQVAAAAASAKKLTAGKE